MASKLERTVFILSPLARAKIWGELVEQRMKEKFQILILEWREHPYLGQEG